MAMAIECAIRDDTPDGRKFNRIGSNRRASVDSPTAPRARLAMVMPNWLAESIASRRSSARRTASAAPLFAAARVSIFERRTLTSANSTATKNPFANTRIRTARILRDTQNIEGEELYLNGRPSATSTIKTFAKLHGPILGPRAIFVGLSNSAEGHVPAIFRRHQQHERVFRDPVVGERPEGNERIVLGVNDQGRYANALGVGERARFRVIVASAVEAVVMLEHLVPIP